MEEQTALRLTRQMMQAVLFCHTLPSGRVCHRDLKHANFVLDKLGDDAVVKLVDFGLSVVLSDEEPLTSGYAGTLYYMAPEIVLRKHYNEACDIWSMGVIVYYLLCGKPPFFGATKSDTVTAIAGGAYKPMTGATWPRVSEIAKDFVSKLLVVDPSQRLSARDTLNHSWMFDNLATPCQAVTGSGLSHSCTVDPCNSLCSSHLDRAPVLEQVSVVLL